MVKGEEEVLSFLHPVQYIRREMGRFNHHFYRSPLTTINSFSAKLLAMAKVIMYSATVMLVAAMAGLASSESSIAEPSYGPPRPLPPSPSPIWTPNLQTEGHSILILLCYQRRLRRR
ncbi:uncharacterized protein LOC135201253 [Macrobrachium nipponense]|uniref:uncharacterized protein LOC135201253 n=1 Tax=Macrobrachium nipponense TaxID=159736 RepID=UPI0030C88FA5